MEKLLFWARTDTVSEKNSVSKKVNREYMFFQEVYDTFMISQSGFNVVITHDNNHKFVCKSNTRMKHLLNINAVTLKLIKEQKIKNVYMRYPKCNPIFLKLLKEMKKLGCRIIIEMPTFPYDAEISSYGKGFHNRTIFIVDKIFRNSMKKYVYRFSTYNDSDYIFGVKTIRIVNGLFVEELRERNIRKVQNEINIIGVASMQVAHGYERLIEGLREYYSHDEDIKVKLLLVGDGREKPKYIDLVKKYRLKEYVEFYDYCNGKELDDLYDKADIAIEFLASFRNRNGLKISSSLKSREYLAKGLLMISDTNIDVLTSDYPYIMKVVRDETNIDVKEIVNYYNSIFSVKDKEHVAKEIRNYCKEHCDLRKTMLPIVCAFDEN